MVYPPSRNSLHSIFTGAMARLASSSSGSALDALHSQVQVNYYNAIGLPVNDEHGHDILYRRAAKWRNNRTLNYIRMFSLSHAIKVAML